MKKSISILALALSLIVPTVNASTVDHLPTPTVVINKEAKVSALCKAAATGNITAVKQLLKNGVDINQKSNGMMPIHYAARFNRVDVIKVLITEGSEIHKSCDNGLTAVQHAEKTNAKEAAQFLKRFKK